MLIDKGYEVKIEHIKKEGEDSHSSPLDVYLLDRKDTVSVIVDDFICTGATIQSILKSIKIPVNILCVSGNYDAGKWFNRIDTRKIRYCITSI